MLLSRHVDLDLITIYESSKYWRRHNTTSIKLFLHYIFDLTTGTVGKRVGMDPRNH